jgi:undecaprenyl-diphosphatase
MATPITAGAGVYETRKLLAGEAGVDVQVAPLVAGMVAALAAGLAAIAILLRFLRTHPTTIFIAYRLVLAAVVVVAWLGLWDRQG